VETRAKVKKILEILISQTKKKSIESIIQSLNNPLNIKHKPVINVIIKTTSYLPIENTPLKERIFHIMNDLLKNQNVKFVK